MGFSLDQYLTMAEVGRCFHKACHCRVMRMEMNILLDKIHLRIINMHIVLKSIVNVHLVQWASRWPTLPRGLGNVSTMIESHMRRHSVTQRWRRSLKLKLLDLSEPGGVLISTLNGEIAIGSVPGFAMAASEDERVPFPAVEEPEGADIPTKEKLRYG